MSSILKSTNIIDSDKPVMIRSCCANNSPMQAAAGMNVAAEAYPSTSAEEKAELIMEEARENARDLLDRAKEEALKILNDAEKEAALVRERARAQGYNEGLRQGAEAGRKEYEDDCIMVLDCLKKLQSDSSSIISGMEEEIVNLILDITGKVLMAEIDAHEDLFINMVQQALSKIRVPDNLTLRVNPRWYEGACRLKENPPSGKDWIRGMRVIQDENMDEGDCLIETGCGTIDTGIATQVELISKAFRGLLAGG